MMSNIINLIARFAREGILHREEVKNDKAAVIKLMRMGLVKKIHRNRKIFYELTEKSVPILDARRKVLFEEAKIMAAMCKLPSIFHALVNDSRFLDEKHSAAARFKFLGDWQLLRPVVSAQLELARTRFYKKHI